MFTVLDIIRKYLHIHVIEVTLPVIQLNEHFIEKSVFDVMSEEDILDYIDAYLSELNIDGKIYIKRNDYKRSLYDKTNQVMYEVVTDTDTYEGILQIHTTSLIQEKDTGLYVWILSGTLGIGILILWGYKMKKRQNNR